MALVVKNLPANTGDIRDAGLISGLGRSPGGGHGNPLQYSCLESPMDREAWWATVHQFSKSSMWLKQLSMLIIISDVEHICKCLLAICVSFGESLFWSSVHFLTVLFDNLILSCVNSLYILVINPLSVALFANIFSYSVDCLFFLFMVFFAVQKLLRLIRSHLFIFVFIQRFRYSRWYIKKKYHYNLCERVFCLCFPLGTL